MLELSLDDDCQALVSPRRGFSQGAKETLGSQEAGCSRDTAYIYTRLSMAVDALDEAGALTFGSKEIFWEVSIHHKRTSATFYERAPPVNIPARSISDLRNGQNHESGNRGSGCSGGLRSLRDVQREYPSRFRAPQNDWSCPNPNSGNRKP